MVAIKYKHCTSNINLLIWFYYVIYLKWQQAKGPLAILRTLMQIYHNNIPGRETEEHLKFMFIIFYTNKSLNGGTTPLEMFKYYLFCSIFIYFFGKKKRKNAFVYLT